MGADGGEIYCKTSDIKKFESLATRSTMKPGHRCYYGCHHSQS